MEQLVQLVSQKAGIDEQQASQAVETVMGFLRDRLPEPIAQQVSGVMEGGDADGGISGLMGRFGKGAGE